MPRLLPLSVTLGALFLAVPGHASASCAGTWSYSGAAQGCTIETTGAYRIEAWGANGGNSTGTGGQGAYASGVFTLDAGQSLYLLVGGRGSDSSGQSQYFDPLGGGGGGGGSFVTLVLGILNYEPLLIAGGGGGAGSSNSAGGGAGLGFESAVEGGGSGTEGSAGKGGTGGNGGQLGNNAGGGAGGAGYLTDGRASGTASGGKAFGNGGAGGMVITPNIGGGAGAFGGGGAGGSYTDSENPGGGGGGGYSGGGGGGVSFFGTGGTGGGGDSFIANFGTSGTAVAGHNDGFASGNGQIVITAIGQVAVAEPASTALFLSGLALMGWTRRRARALAP